MRVTCAHCRAEIERPSGHINRQRKRYGESVPFFCSRACFGLAHRSGKDNAQKVREKAAYDERRRADLCDAMREEKRAYHRRTYDPVKAAIARAPKLAWQRQYGKQYRQNPEWVAHKAEYDKQLRASEYGEFAECYLILLALQNEVRKEAWYDRKKSIGYFDTINLRKREDRRERRQERIAP